MIDEKSDQNGAQETAQNTETESGRALVGKIARLPNKIREQLNQRLQDGLDGPEILAWLNELPVVKQILAAKFGGTPINHHNLCKWRKIGYERWLQKQEPIQELKWLGEAASDYSRAGAGKLAHGVAALAGAWLMEFLCKTPPDKCSSSDIAKISFAATALLKGEQANSELKLAEKRVLQRDEQLLLTRDRDQRNVVAIGLRLLGDMRAKEIEGSAHSYSEKIELLGFHMFQDLWQTRLVPEAGNSDTTPMKTVAE